MYSDYERRNKSGMVIGSKEELEALNGQWLTIREVLATVALTRQEDDCGDANHCHSNFVN
jgi:hypothetical protein